MIRNAASITVLLFALGACREATVSADPPGITDRLIVSDPSPGVRQYALVAAATADPPATQTFISLPTSTLDEGSIAHVANRRTGVAFTVAMVDGGLPPVAIEAQVGDIIAVTIKNAAGVELARIMKPVPVSRSPVVVRTRPPRGKKDVPLNIRIEVVFSEPIDPGSIDAGSIRLLNGPTLVSGRVEPSDTELTTATFVPSAPLRTSATYTLEITRAIRDLDGDSLTAPEAVSFSTDGATSTAAVQSITLNVDTITAHAGADILFALRAAALDAGGRELKGVGLQWGTSDSSIAYIAVSRSVAGERAMGWIAGRGQEGTATITAFAGGQSRSAVVVLQDLNRAALQSVTMGPVDRLCLLTTAGSPYCQGGYDKYVPVLVPGGLAFDTVVVGRNHSCALTPDDVAYCWGRNYSGQLGAPTQKICDEYDEHLKASCEPIRVSGDLTFTQIGVGRFHTCGLTAEAAVYCWGEGYGATPRRVAEEHRFLRIDVGAGSCGLTEAGALYCWDPYSAAPVNAAAGRTFVDLAVGNQSSIAGQSGHACGLTEESSVVCVVGSATDSVFEVALPPGVTLATLDGGLRHTCGLARDGAAYCWGWVFDWDIFDRVKFETNRVQGLTFVSVSSGGGGFDGEEGRACGLAADGLAYCWDPAVGQPWRVLR